MDPVEIKDLVTEMPGVIVLPVQEDSADPNGEVITAFDDQESLEKDISLAPVILEDKDIQASDSGQVIQVKLDLQDGDTSLYHEENLDQQLKSEGIDLLE